MRRKTGCLLVFGLLLLVAGCRAAPEPAAPVTRAPQSWDTFVVEFLDAYFVAHPNVAVYVGRHEFDGKLPDWSATGIKQEIDRLKSWRARALDFREADLDEGERFERAYLMAQIDNDLFWLEAAEWPFRSPRFYAGALDPNVYVSREYAPLETRMRAYIEYAKAVPLAAQQVRSNLRLPLPRPYVNIGRISFGGLASYYENDVPTVFGPVKNEQLQSEFRSANAGAISAMKELDAWLMQQEGAATDTFAMGADLFGRMLGATEQVDVPLDTLKAIGERDLERNLASLAEACAKFAPGKPLQACVDKERADKPKGSPVEAARAQLKELRAFVEANDIVSIPGPEQARVAESPPYQRYNFAYIDIAGPYEKNVPSIYYIAPPDPTWTKAEQAAYLPGRASLLATSAHEVWPGHFLQFLHANRAASTFGQVFVGYAFAEGWAHYAEEMMVDAGLGKGDPQIRVGQVLQALLRNVRFLSAIGLQTGGMTVAESEQLFREKAFSDVGTARQQAARGTFDPAYLNYTLGKLMIRKLRDDWVSTRGGRAAWKAFHDEFLKYGGPPIPLVRRAMLGSDKGPLF